MYELKYVWRHSTLITPSLTARHQSLLQSRSVLILQSSQSAGLAIDSVDVSGETISLSTILRLAVDFLDVTYLKGKAVPLQAWSGPDGSRKLRFPDFMTTAQDGGKVVSLMHRPPSPTGNTPGTHFC